MHLRPPSLDPGLTAGLWGIGLGLYVVLGGLAIGLGRAESFILGGLAAAAVFLRVFWHRLLVTLRIRKPSEPEPRSSARAVAAPELEHVETAREPTGKR